MILDPQTFGNFYRVLTGVVVPRPIALVSSIDNDGVLNLAPFSFFNAVASEPPTIVFSSNRNTPHKPKDTLANIEANGEFVVNVVVDDIAQAMNATAAEYPAEVSEFDVAGLTPVPSQVVRPPRVLESPVNMECKLNRVVPLGNPGHEHGLVIGEIVLMHVRDDIIDGHRINHQLLKPVGRLAGSMYCFTADVYEMARPVYQPEASAQTATGDS